MIRLLRWGPRNGPQTPNARRASAKPRRASIILAGVGAPKWPPNPQRSSRLGEAAARLDHPRRCGGPEMAPKPPPPPRLREPAARLDHPRRCGGPEMARPFDWGPRNGPQTPHARRAPGNPGRASMSPALVATRERMAGLDVGPNARRALETRGEPRCPPAPRAPRV